MKNNKKKHNKSVKNLSKKAPISSLAVFIIIAAFLFAGGYFIGVTVQEEGIQNKSVKIIKKNSSEDYYFESEKENDYKKLSYDVAESGKSGYKLLKFNEVDLSLLWPNDWDLPEDFVSAKAEGYIGNLKYNGDYIYDAESNAWYVIKDGDRYYVNDVPTIRKSKDATIWSFGFGDAGCGNNVPTFVVGDQMVMFSLPLECPGVDTTEVYLKRDSKEVKEVINIDEYNEGINIIIDSISIL